MAKDELQRRIMKDVGVELSEEFDLNFTRKAFFDEPWPKRIHNYSRGTVLAQSNRLRRSYKRHISGTSIRITSDAPYAGIHNAGGKVPITPQMRKFFWAKYYEASGKIGKTKTGKVSVSTRNVQLSDQAKFYRNMALHKGSHIVIPKRQVVGNHPEVKRIVERVANASFQEYAKTTLIPTLKKK